MTEKRGCNSSLNLHRKPKTWDQVILRKPKPCLQGIDNWRLSITTLSHTEQPYLPSSLPKMSHPKRSIQYTDPVKTTQPTNDRQRVSTKLDEAHIYEQGKLIAQVYRSISGQSGKCKQGVHKRAAQRISALWHAGEYFNQINGPGHLG